MDNPVKKLLKFYFEHHCYSWTISGPWYNTIVCLQFHASYFEDCVTTSRRDRYNLMCPIESHDIEHPTLRYYTSSGGGISLPPDSKIWVSISWPNTKLHRQLDTIIQYKLYSSNFNLLLTNERGVQENSCYHS